MKIEGKQVNNLTHNSIRFVYSFNDFLMKIRGKKVNDLTHDSIRFVTFYSFNIYILIKIKGKM